MILSVLYNLLLIKTRRTPTSKSTKPLIINSTKLIVALVGFFFFLPNLITSFLLITFILYTHIVFMSIDKLKNSVFLCFSQNNKLIFS